MDRPAAVVRQKELRKGISMPTEQDKVDVWGQAVHEEYYILQSDPDERQNLIHTNADNLNKLKNVLSEYISKCSSRQGRGQDSENDEKMRLSPEELEDLRTLGYL